MRAHDFIKENTYGGYAAQYPYGRGIRRGDTVRNVHTGETFVVLAVEGSKIVLDNHEVVTPRADYVVVKSKNQIDELYDPEGKYTGAKPPAPPPPPRKGGGPDWEGDDNPLWREFLTLMREKLIERDFKILYPRNPDETALLLDANWPPSMWKEQHLGAMRIWFDLNQDYTATLHILAWKAGMLPEKPTTAINPEVEPWENRKFRVRITDFEFALRKIGTIQQIVISSRFKPTNESILTESATDVLYHATTSLGARDILRDGEFKLTASLGTYEHEYSVRNRPYFLSTTRSKTGDYHARYPSIGSTVFALDGRWLGQRYAVRPIDYWGSAWVHNKSGRTRESEDRVYSRTNTIPLTPVTAIHVYIQHQTPEKIERSLDPEARTRDFARSDAYRWDEIREMSQLAEQRGIPVYIYYNLRDWKVQNTARAEHPEDVIELQHGLQREPYNYTPDRTFGPLLELITTDPSDESKLSTTAARLLYNIRWYSDTYKGLESDMHNSRKASSSDYRDAVTVVSYMSRNKLRTMRELMDAIKTKWEKEQ